MESQLKMVQVKQKDKEKITWTHKTHLLFTA